MEGKGESSLKDPGIPGAGIFLIEPGEKAWQVELQDQQRFAAQWKNGRRRSTRLKAGGRRVLKRARFMFLDPEATPEQVEWLVSRFKEAATNQAG
jgi:hypothetical protein